MAGYIKSSDLETQVATIVAQKWPRVATVGMFNVPIEDPAALQAASALEGSEFNSRLLFFNGTSHFCGKRVVGD